MRNEFCKYFENYGGQMFEFPDISGKYKGKKLLVLADAACVWQDVESFGAVCHNGRGSVCKEGHDIMAINKIGEVLPGHIEHWYSNEGNLLQAFIAARRNEYRKEFQGPNHTHSCNTGAKYHWPWGGWGTSGLAGILTGLALGYDKILVCGMPLDESPHNGEPPWRKCRFTTEVSDTVNGGSNHHWRHAIKTAFKGKVQFASGRAKFWTE